MSTATATPGTPRRTSGGFSQRSQEGSHGPPPRKRRLCNGTFVSRSYPVQREQRCQVLCGVPASRWHGGPPHLPGDSAGASTAHNRPARYEETDQLRGAFYINEFFDVLVPTQAGGCFYAGTYEKLLEFDFEGEIISPRPPAGLQPSKPWPGPHVGIRYTLTSGGNDIKYWRQVGPGRIQEHRLSDYAGQPAAAQLANRLRQIKGLEGGRIYINEVGEFFAPTDHGDSTVSYVYLGPLEDDLWFSAPDVSRA